MLFIKSLLKLGACARQILAAVIIGLVAIQAVHAKPIPLWCSSARGDNFTAASSIDVSYAYRAVAEEELIDIPGYDAVYPLGYVMFHEMAKTILGTVKRLTFGAIMRYLNGEPVYDLFAFRSADRLGTGLYRAWVRGGELRQRFAALGNCG